MKVRIRKILIEAGIGVAVMAFAIQYVTQRVVPAGWILLASMGVTAAGIGLFWLGGKIS